MQTDENGQIESFNGRLRDECLNVIQFMSLAEARAEIEAWRVDCSQRRPHSSPGHLIPSGFVGNRQENRIRNSAEL
jgi:putative transposase